MANKKITELPQSNTTAPTDLLVVVKDPAGSATTVKMTANILFSNVSTLNATALRVSNNIIIPSRVAPANTIAGTGIAGGTMFYDANYLYIATANNTVKRVALSTF
jgi:hypothetical protein